MNSKSKQFYIVVNSVKNNFLICSNTNSVKVFNNFLYLDCKSKNSNNTSLCQKKKKERLILNILFTLQFHVKWQDHIWTYIYVTSLPLPSNPLFKVFIIFDFFNESNS